MAFADKVIRFNNCLELPEQPIPGIYSLNPFKGNAEIHVKSGQFYQKFYADKRPRRLILGINPGRLGAGATGIPFTDTKRLSEICGIQLQSVHTYEPSSVFVYEVIDAYGGAELFYNNYYINSVCPLGFVTKSKKGNWVNSNYYDFENLYHAVYDFMVASLKEQISFGIDTKTCYVLGKKNGRYLERINDSEKLFERLEVFDHPRYIMQYKNKEKERYLADYLARLPGSECSLV